MQGFDTLMFRARKPTTNEFAATSFTAHAPSDGVSD
jgi:hypothetical protein